MLTTYTLPITLWSGAPSLMIPSNYKKILGALKIPLNGSSLTGSTGGKFFNKIGPSGEYWQIYGVSQSVNGVVTKQMRKPN